ncbi:MAG: hypothetical protein MR739_08420 [Spirochaetia bacterium]|nr:hypothetical protein [Spirochaetia bacterium]
MNIRIIRKAISLLIVDVIIIIGIFILQFRTDSSIIEKIGNLQLTFSQTEDAEKGMILQNKFRLTYNGINFYFDNQNPVTVVKSDETKSSLTLESWQKDDDLSYTLNFSDDVKITFNLDSTEENASLFINTVLPSQIHSIFLPYNYSSNIKIEQQENHSLVLNNKKDSWQLAAESVDSGLFALSNQKSQGLYSLYQEETKFTFDILKDSPLADLSLFQKNIAALKTNLISSYKSNTNNANISEQVIVSYIAAQAEKGNYSVAIEEIPSSLKKSSQRTYLSAPYFNTLSDMNELLEKTISDYEAKISANTNAESLDIFTIHNISNYMAIHSNPKDVKSLLENTSSKDLTNASISQVSGILQVYVNLVDLIPSYAKLLEPILPSCIEKITQACSYDNEKLSISENGTFLSVMQAVEIGFTVMRYGIQINDNSLQNAGYVLVNSYLSENSSFDLRTLANLYPIIAYDNWYYPHLQIINKDFDDFMWAWTCARTISYEKESDNTLNLTIDFPEGYTHYVILKGLPHFYTIYIYDMAFRTDPRFETYNSSGYVYKQQSETLLLKSRHKTRKENIRFDFNELENKNTSEKKKEKLNETKTVKTSSEISSIESSQNTKSAETEQNNSLNNQETSVDNENTKSEN